ncbi:type II toxin-antitoxin system VapC family toxin [Microbacterium sp.]|uniref:type II toxin-antitoxin system VapC family toxin n=1 Tax=Microbacterium sp. TaxID=51671 RepID=UPI003C75D156
MIVLDANVLISYWGRPDSHTDATYSILDTEDELLIHPITLAETLVAPVREGREDDALSAYARLGVERHDPTLDEPVRVARLRAETRLKLPEAYVLAAAIEMQAALATFDKRLADAARERGVAVLGA